MKLSKEYHKIILDEFKNVDELCTKAQNVKDKLYFFSASYGIVQRVFNISCDPILVFMHQVLQNVHQLFNNRISSIKEPNHIYNAVPVVYIEYLLVSFRELIDAFENSDDERIREALQSLSNLGYACNGNGYYLYHTGRLKLD
jgi:DNA-binding GntR family transcriptional regulator